MGDAILTVRCVCGWETTGPEPEVVAATVDHGRRVHNMTPSHDEVLAMAVKPDGAASVPEGTAAPAADA